MNAFHKKIVLVLLPLYNSFLKIELNCVKKIMLILNICSCQKKMLSNLLIDKMCSKDGLKDSCSEKFIKFAEKYS